MNPTTQYIPAGEVILDAAQAVNDDGFRALQRPFYMSQVQQAITELAFDTSYHERVWEEVIPSTAKLALPSDMVNINVIYLFNGESCDVNNSQVCHIKYNYQHKGGEGYTAQNKWNNLQDPIIPPAGFGEPPDTLYYYGIQQGFIMLSPNCTSFERIRIEYAGTGVKFGDEPMVPGFARQAVTEYVIHKAARVRQHENPNLFRPIMNDAMDQLKSPQGEWIKARARIGRMTKAEREDMYAYMTKYTNRW